MWIIRLHKLQPKDYNYIGRALKKIGFIPRKISPIIFAKALLLHLLQKKSWRNIAIFLHCNHIPLYNFYHKNKKNPEIKKIFHYFLKARIIVFTGNKKTFSQYDLDNSEELYLLTKREINCILKE